MDAFPRTDVGGISLSRMIIGTNWFLGFSHTSWAKDRFIKAHMTRDRIVEIIKVFMDAGVDTIMGPLFPLLIESVEAAQDATGRKMHLILTPHFSIRPGGPPEEEAEVVLRKCAEAGAEFCFPHTSRIDPLVDQLNRTIRQYDGYAKRIRELGMLPGLSTHLPESVIIADESGADVVSYIQIYNAAGFLMHLEADWEMRIIQKAKKPVMTIKPMAAGRLLPVVGLSFVWSTLRDCDMVTVGTMTPDEAKECIEISMSLLEKRIPEVELQKTRSKASVESGKG
jgi:hypothetical protein